MLEVPSFFEEMKNNISYKEKQSQQTQQTHHTAESSNVILKREKGKFLLLNHQMLLRSIASCREFF